MPNSIYSIEIDLSAGAVPERVEFDEEMIRAYLGGLSACYHEVLILSHGFHAIVYAVGTSPDLLFMALSEFRRQARIVSASCSTREGVSTLMKISKGERWGDLSNQEVYDMLQRGACIALDVGSLGKDLKRLVQKAIRANVSSSRYYQWTNPTIGPIHYPTITEFDYSKLPLN